MIPNRVLQAMHQPSPNIYTGHLGDAIETVKKDLNTIAGSSGNVALYASNGHGVWESALANIVMPGETVIFLATGQFSLHWAVLARSLGIDAKITMHLGISSLGTQTHKVIKSPLNHTK